MTRWHRNLCSLNTVCFCLFCVCIISTARSQSLWTSPRWLIQVSWRVNFHCHFQEGNNHFSCNGTSRIHNVFSFSLRTIILAHIFTWSERSAGMSKYWSWNRVFNASMYPRIVAAQRLLSSISFLRKHFLIHLDLVDSCRDHGHNVSCRILHTQLA